MGRFSRFCIGLAGLFYRGFCTWNDVACKGLLADIFWGFCVASIKDCRLSALGEQVKGSILLQSCGLRIRLVRPHVRITSSVI